MEKTTSSTLIIFTHPLNNLSFTEERNVTKWKCASKSTKLPNAFDTTIENVTRSKVCYRVLTATHRYDNRDVFCLSTKLSNSLTFVRRRVGNDVIDVPCPNNCT